MCGCFSALLDDLIEKYDPAPEEALRIAFQKNLPNNDSATFLPPIRRCLKDSPYLRTSGDKQNYCLADTVVVKG